MESISPGKTICCTSTDAGSLYTIMERRNRNWFHWQIKGNTSRPLVSIRPYLIFGNELFELYCTQISYCINFIFVTVLGVNKNRKLVAFAERGERPHVVVYDLESRKRKTVLRYLP